MDSYWFCGHDGESYQGQVWFRKLDTDDIARSVALEIARREGKRRMGIWKAQPIVDGDGIYQGALGKVCDVLPVMNADGTYATVEDIERLINGD